MRTATGFTSLPCVSRPNCDALKRSCDRHVHDAARAHQNDLVVTDVRLSVSTCFCASVSVFRRGLLSRRRNRANRFEIRVVATHSQ